MSRSVGCCSSHSQTRIRVCTPSRTGYAAFATRLCRGCQRRQTVACHVAALGSWGHQKPCRQPLRNPGTLPHLHALHCTPSRCHGGAAAPLVLPDCAYITWLRFLSPPHSPLILPSPLPPSAMLDAIRARFSSPAPRAESAVAHHPEPTLAASARAIATSSWLNVLLVFIPVSWALHYAKPDDDVMIFVCECSCCCLHACMALTCLDSLVHRHHSTCTAPRFRD
jgi:hypothetical protein